MADADLRTHYPTLPSIISFAGKRIAAEPSYSNCAKSRRPTGDRLAGNERRKDQSCCRAGTDGAGY
jgi:hypothetical protein